MSWDSMQLGQALWLNTRRIRRTIEWICVVFGQTQASESIHVPSETTIEQSGAGRAIANPTRIPGGHAGAQLSPACSA